MKTTIHGDPDERLDLGYVEAAVQFPRNGKRIRCRLPIAHEISCHLGRLPRGRELPFLPDEAVRARRQRHQRQEWARYIATALTECILKAAESDDTINGYDPDEWQQMTTPEY